MLLNVDRVAEQLQELGHAAIQVRGLVDSGWFLDNKQYHRTDCVDTATCAPTDAIRLGIRWPGAGPGLGWEEGVLCLWEPWWGRGPGRAGPGEGVPWLREPR